MGRGTARSAVVGFFRDSGLRYARRRSPGFFGLLLRGFEESRSLDREPIDLAVHRAADFHQNRAPDRRLRSRHPPLDRRSQTRTVRMDVAGETAIRPDGAEALAKA